jgi:hypothetical protein
MIRIKKIYISLLCLGIIVGITVFFGTHVFPRYSAYKETKRIEQEKEQAITAVLNARKAVRTPEIQTTSTTTIFGDDGMLNILFLGIDKRIGQTEGHCDAIQMIHIDTNKSLVRITAVPRGTYSPLPPGKGTTSSDYYVSNACGLGGLAYGIDQIERILGEKADYVAVIGFSETLGLLRTAGLPTTETLQWLRHRQGYAIGEPQRAHNHSTFIKQMIVKFVPDSVSSIDTALAYLAYNKLSTDFSFQDAKIILEALATMQLASHPERIELAMKPAYRVQDIAYDQAHVPEDVQKMLAPLQQRLSKKDFSQEDIAIVQQRLIDTIAEKKNDPAFVTWAVENDIWLQIEDAITRETIHYELLTSHLTTLPHEEAIAIIGDYILEMEYLNIPEFATKGKALLETYLK